MTRDERLTRALQYVRQALERLDGLEGQVVLAADVTGAWVSLRRNLESATADLNLALTDTPLTP